MVPVTCLGSISEILNNQSLLQKCYATHAHCIENLCAIQTITMEAISVHICIRVGFKIGNDMNPAVTHHDEILV